MTITKLPVSTCGVNAGLSLSRKALMRAGLALLQAKGGGARGGNPGYYKRFGFRNIPGLIHEGIPPEVFLDLPFGGKIPQGTVHFHEAFLASSY